MNETLSRNIKTYRIKAKLTQEQLAHACGYKYQSAVGMWELGERTPKTDALLPLATTLGVTVDELLREGETA